MKTTNSPSTTKCNKFFLGDSDNIDMKDTYRIQKTHPPTDKKDDVSKEYCDYNPIFLLSSSFFLVQIKNKYFK